MPRETFPRSSRAHAEAASKVLIRHASRTGVPLSLPIPIELIVEQTYGLEILWEDIPEPTGTVILGALAPSDRRIVLNVRHEALLEEVMGPERFTLAHELAHWIYDADNPDQLALPIDGPPVEHFCVLNGSLGLSDTFRIREINANKFAAHLLLPEYLVKRANIAEVLRDLPSAARGWGVSRTTLQIRLEDLGLMEEKTSAQLDFL